MFQTTEKLRVRFNQMIFIELKKIPKIKEYDDGQAMFQG